MLRFEGGRHTAAHRRHQFTLWKGQAATTVVRTLQGCCTLARRELASWRGRSKVSSRSEDAYKPSDAECIHPTDQQSSRNFKRSRRSSYNSSTSSFSITSSLSSATDVEEERRKELRRSEFSTYTPRVAALETNPSEFGFAESTSGSHERLLLVDVLPLNDSDDDDDAKSSSASRHLPYRTTLIDGRPHLLRNEWV
ncbi:hypothetical protein PRNP1_002655 [Phytophthora ramorum]|uniref:uncharacterized protein n=1 Tax=Phytophthora ramorum TaxID=164328 RepID=UPI0030ADE705|nr:hypothetical protein KRP23_751 [Phytophthora ramorum]